MRNALLSLLVLVSVALSVSPLAASSDDDHVRARQAREAGQIVPLAKVLESAQAKHQGTVVEVELEQENGRWEYEIEILTSDGQVIEVSYDAATGAWLESEHEGPSKVIRP